MNFGGHKIPSAALLPWPHKTGLHFLELQKDGLVVSSRSLLDHHRKFDAISRNYGFVGFADEWVMISHD
jgi:hypothetical protein